MRGVISRRAWRVARVLLAAAVVAAAAGCGSNAPQPDAARPSTMAAATLENRQWGFQLKYPSTFVKVEPPVDAQKDPGLLYHVYLADPTGAKSGGAALDVLGIAVRRMSRAAKRSDLRTHAAEFKAMAAQLVGQPEGLHIVQPFRLTTLGGRPALEGEYAYRLKGTDVAAVAYLIPVHDRAYWVTGQASRQTWAAAGREIGSALATLTLD
jgi:hypothetical protein